MLAVTIPTPISLPTCPMNNARAYNSVPYQAINPQSRNILMSRPTVNTSEIISSRLSLGVAALPKRSLIDNTLARACSLKRARDEAGATAPLKKSKLDAVVGEAKLAHAKITLTNVESGIKSISSNAPSFDSSSSYNSNSFDCSSPVCYDSDSSDLSDSCFDNMCPYTFIEEVLIEDENDDDVMKQMQPVPEAEFIHPTEEQIAAYSNEALSAVRSSDLDGLRKLLSEGHTLRCCNRSGESLLHMACRRSSPAVVSFLLNEANVSPKIKDDYGRTPMHDACWRGTAELEIVEILLVAEPRLAFVKDVRGHQPFQYARREHWVVWRDFLWRKRGLILP